MKELYEDLMKRWRQAFDEIGLIDSFKAKSDSLHYANFAQYELKDYGSSRFLQGNFFSEKPVNGDYHVYGIGKNGLPCYTHYRHSWNEIDWEGYYIYSDGVIEFVEYCINTKIPSKVVRVLYENGRKSSFQRLSINGGGSGSFYEGMSKEVIVDRILNDEGSVICDIERYVYEGDRIARADCFMIMPGLGERYYKQLYSYNDSGELDVIKAVYDNGTSQLLYAYIPAGTGEQSISNDLSEKLAEAVVEALLNEHIEQPIAYLELSFRIGSNYTPMLKPVSADDREQLIQGEDFYPGLIFSIYEAEYYPVPDSSFERLMQQLKQLSDDAEDSRIMVSMLRRTGYLLTTTKLLGKVAVTHDFVAFPIDWELESNELESIFGECGVPSAMIDSWREQEWI